MKQDEFVMEVDRLKQELKSLGMNAMVGKLNNAVAEYWDLIHKTNDDRVKAEGYRYFINHNLGKPTTRLDIDTGQKPEGTTEKDVLEEELREFDEEEEKANEPDLS